MKFCFLRAFLAGGSLLATAVFPSVAAGAALPDSASSPASTPPPVSSPPAANVTPPRPTPPTRAPDAPGAPKFRVAGAKPGQIELRTFAGALPPPNAEGDWLVGPEYRRAPELTKVAGVPEGRVVQFTLRSADSKFYPGIAREEFGTVDPANPRTLRVAIHPQPYERTISVYVPQQLVAGAVAPLLLMHDGPALGKPFALVPEALDNLIAQNRVPAMVAIAIQNGGGDAQGSQRGLEYDTMSGRFAEFIEAEVLPAVEAQCGVKLSRDPEARAAMGNSSGGAAAFIMAWYHPDLYRRVIAFSGTFVNQQWPFNPETPGGAWDFHTRLIAESSPKPLRLWLHVGDRDFLNPNVMRDDMHDWVEANHRMAAVLRAKGYHYQYVFALNSGHVDSRVREQLLPYAIEWVWRDYTPTTR